MIDLVRLERFVTLAQTRNFSKAAVSLHISQPALSRSIRELEIAVGASLFDRDRSGAVLTPVGSQLLSGAIDLVQHARHLESRILEISHGLAGEARFALSAGIATNLLTPVLIAMFERHPGISVACEIGPTEMMRRKLLDGEIEFFVGRIDGSVPPPLVPETIGRVSLRLMVRHDHPLATQSGLAPEDLIAFPRLSSGAWNTDIGRRFGPIPPKGLLATVTLENFGIILATTLASDAIMMTALPVEDDRVVELDMAAPYSRLEPGAVIAIQTIAGRRLSAVGRAAYRLVVSAARDSSLNAHDDVEDLAVKGD